MHKVEKIISMLQEKLDFLITVDRDVNRIQLTTAIEPEELPVVAIELLDDQLVLEINTDLADWALQLSTSVILSQKTDDNLLQKILTIRNKIQSRLMADRKLGLDFIIDTSPISMGQVTFNNEGELVICNAQIVWSIRYRSSISNPSYEGSH